MCVWGGGLIVNSLVCERGERGMGWAEKVAQGRVPVCRGGGEGRNF